jgi:quercetin dioxygenase-like cupin family protein
MRSARIAGSFTLLALMVGIGALWAHVAAAQDAVAGQGTTAMEMRLYPLTDLQWRDGPASLPQGAKLVVLEGDPATSGPFTMRLRLPDGYQIPPHYHSGVEHVTVIAGTFNVGMGEKFDRAATKPMVAGTFGYWPPPMRHFAWTQGETTLQLHGDGPWTVTYVNKADDPRQR